MATKFYFNNGKSGYSPPAFQGGWDLTATQTHVCDPVKYHQVETTSQLEAQRTETSATNPFRVCCLRLISRRLAAQTITGTVDICASLFENASDANMFTRLHMYVQRTDDDSILGTLLSQYEETSAGGGTEWPSAATTGRQLQSAQTLTDVTIPSDGNDYRLVIELGYRAENTTSSGRFGSVWYGSRTNNVANADLSPGDVSLGDSRAAWIEFSGTVTLHADCFANVSPETATVLTLNDLDSSFAFDCQQGGTGGEMNYMRWWVHTAAAKLVVSFFPWYSFSGGLFLPQARVYSPDNPIWSSMTNYSAGGSDGKPVIAQALPTERLFFTIRPNTFADFSFGANGTVEFETAAIGVPDVESILINDDSDYDTRPAPFVNTATGEVISYALPVYTGEGGDRLGRKTLLTDAFNNTDFKIYDAAADFAVHATVSFSVGGGTAAVRAQPVMNRFVVAGSSGSVIKEYDPDGAEIGSFTTTGFSPSSLAMNNDRSRLLFPSGGSTGPGWSIKQWDINGGAITGDLVAGLAGYLVYDIFVLTDTSVLALYYNSSTRDVKVRRYAASDGTLLNNYDIGTTAPNGVTPRLFWGPEDASNFWVYWFAADGIANLTKIAIVSGTAFLINTPNFDSGVSETPATPTPTKFGVSTSCPLIVIPSAVEWEDPEPSSPFECPCPCSCDGGGGGDPLDPGSGNGSDSSPDDATGDVETPIDMSQWTVMCEGPGNVPAATDPTDVESWVS